jgi:hypothetical protein
MNKYKNIIHLVEMNTNYSNCGIHIKKGIKHTLFLELCDCDECKHYNIF